VTVNVSHTWLLEAALVLSCEVGVCTIQIFGHRYWCRSVEAKYLELSSEPVTVVRAWLSCWKNRNLLIRGQVVLIKSVSFTLPVCFKLSGELWGGGVNLILILWMSIVLECMVWDLKVDWCVFGYSNNAKESLEQFGSSLGRWRVIKESYSLLVFG